MEFIALLNEFTKSNAWSVGSDKIQIKWETEEERQERYRQLTKRDTGYYSHPEKQGNIYITINGEFTDYFQRARLQPVSWNIKMYGARTIYFSCALITKETGRAGESFKKYLKSKGMLEDCYGFKLRKGISLFGTPQFEMYKIRLNTNKSVYILYSGVFMNNACDQAIFFNSDGSESIKFPTEFYQNYEVIKDECSLAEE